MPSFKLQFSISLPLADELCLLFLSLASVLLPVGVQEARRTRTCTRIHGVLHTFQKCDNIGTYSYMQ